MKNGFALLLFILGTSSLFCQNMQVVTPLHSQIAETSGLIFIDGKLITHNDSGGAAALYELDSTTGNVLRTVVIQNASNYDWEAVTRDDSFIYIGDFGNNNGDRTNLRIFKISIQDYINTVNDTVVADTILFSYADQTEFNTTQFSTNYDAEAFISISDSLYIFTKNWGNYWSNIYALPKLPGNYSISKIDSINVQGLITDAFYHAASQKIILTGYTFSPFLVTLDMVTPPFFSESHIIRPNVTTTASIQIEGVSSLDGNTFYISSENHSSGAATLYRTSPIFDLGVQKIAPVNLKVFPNPSSKKITVECEDFLNAKIYTLKGKQVVSSNSQNINISHLPPGCYILEVELFEKMELNYSTIVIE